MKVVIIGATSFLAKNIIKMFGAEYTMELILFSRNAPDIDSIVPYTWQKLELPITEELSTLFLDSDVIVNCLASGVQPKHNQTSQAIFGVNLYTPINLINFLQNNDYQGRLLSFGSYFEIGDTSVSTPLTEEQFIQSDNWLPNDYCISKKMLTTFINKKIKQGLSFNLQHFILTNIYGSGENKNRLIPYIVSSIKDGQPLSFTAGSQIRQFSHIDGIAQFLAQTIADSVTTDTGIYNLSNSETISVKSFIEKVLAASFELVGSEVPVSFGTNDRGDTKMPYLALDSTLLANKYGFEYKEATMHSIINDYLNHYTNIK